MKPRIRWWKLKEDEVRKDFKQRVGQTLSEVLPEDWEETTKALKKIAESVLGVSSGRAKVDKDTWWWNTEVQTCIRDKKRAKKEWDHRRDHQSKMAYRMACKAAKKAVAKAKAEAYMNAI